MNVGTVIRSIVDLAGVPDVTVGLMGAPGVGKTDAASQAAAELGLEIVEIRPAELEPVDFRGIPVPDLETGRTRWLTPEFWPAHKCLILFDELTLAAPDVTAPLLKIMLGRQIGDFKLHPETMVVWTGNHASHKTGAHRVPTALALRSIMIDVEPDFEDWREWYSAQSFHERMVLAYLDSHPEQFFRFDPSNEGGQPNPRNWVRAGHVVRKTRNVEVMRGVVGESADSFVKFCSTFRVVPSVEDVLEGREVAPTALEDQAAWRNEIIRAATSVETAGLARLVDALTESDQVIVMQAMAKSSDSVKIILDPAFADIVDRHADAIQAARLGGQK